MVGVVGPILKSRGQTAAAFRVAGQHWWSPYHLLLICQFFWCNKGLNSTMVGSSGRPSSLSQFQGSSKFSLNTSLFR